MYIYKHTYIIKDPINGLYLTIADIPEHSHWISFLRKALNFIFSAY